jgi:hypothetical protein
VVRAQDLTEEGRGGEGDSGEGEGEEERDEEGRGYTIWSAGGTCGRGPFVIRMGSRVRVLARAQSMPYPLHQYWGDWCLSRCPWGKLDSEPFRTPYARRLAPCRVQPAILRPMVLTEINGGVSTVLPFSG